MGLGFRVQGALNRSASMWAKLILGYCPPPQRNDSWIACVSSSYTANIIAVSSTVTACVPAVPKLRTSPVVANAFHLLASSSTLSLGAMNAAWFAYHDCRFQT